MPTRIQRKRTRGFKLPPNTICCTRPGKFANPFKWQMAREAGYRGTDEQLKEFAIEIFREWLTNPNSIYGHVNQRTKLMIHIGQLRHADYLACWCPLDHPCHVDVLLKFLKENR